MGELSRLLTSVELGALLRLHPKTIERLARAGELPGKKIGRRWVFHEKTIDSFLAGTVASSPVLDVPRESILAR